MGGLKLDGKLLALLNERRLLTKKEFNDINAHILGNNIPAAGEYFVNRVIFQWPLDVFESNVRSLIEALQSHDDWENQSVANTLCRSFTVCGLEVPHIKGTPTIH